MDETATARVEMRFVSVKQTKKFSQGVRSPGVAEFIEAAGVSPIAS